MINIILCGCNGKMGKTISQLCKSRDDIKICAGIDKNTDSLDFPVFETIDKCTVQGDVILDFSRPDSLDSLLKFSNVNSIPLVLCTTGFTNEQIEKIKDFSKTTPIFRSANMSIGVNVLNTILKKISPMLFEGFDIEIIEKHHNQKVDAPSGTAILLADTIKHSLNDEAEFVYGREGIKKREKKEIGIHAVRGGTIVGEHDIIFAGNSEIIELKHTALSRDVFAVGALKACVFMFKKTAGLYNMDDVLNLNM